MLPSQDKLEEIVKELQKILRIQDWDIDVNILSAEEYKKEHDNDDQGHNHITRVLNASLIDINKDTSVDWYITLMHELIHLVFDPIEQAGINACALTNGNISKCIDDNYTVAMERVVDRMAHIMTNLYPVTKFIQEVDKNENSST